MSREEWLDFLNSESKPTGKQFLWEYCKHRGKNNEELFNDFYFLLKCGLFFTEYGATVDSLIEYALDYIGEELSLVILKDKEGIIIKFY